MIADRDVAARVRVRVHVGVPDNVLLGQLSEKTKQCLPMLTNKLTHLSSYGSSPVIISLLQINQEPLLRIRVMHRCNFSKLLSAFRHQSVAVWRHTAYHTVG